MSEKRVSVRLRAEGGGQVRAEFQGVGDTGERAFQRIGREADATGAMIRRLMGIATAFFSARQIVQYADTWTDLQSRVQLAVGSHEAGIAVMGRLGDMARRTYSDLNQTVESWLSNSTALRELGMSTSESLDFTEALNNALVVSGARAERAAQINNALAQAMALGQLRGQQLNTVIMNGGRVAELLAEELGVNVNQLRQLGAQGRITGDVIRRALVGNLELLREEADSMPATIGDAFTLMGNAALQLVGKWDQLSGASSMVADALIALADNLERVASIAIALAGFMAGRWVASFVAARAGTMGLVGALRLLRTALIRTGIGALIVGVGELIYWFSRLVDSAGGFGEAMSALGTLVRAVWSGIVESAKAIPDGLGAIWQNVRAGFLRMVRDLQLRWADFLASISESLEGVRGMSAVSNAFGNAFLNTMRSADSMSRAMDEAERQANRLAESARTRLSGAWDGVTAAVARLREMVTGAGEDGTDAIEDTNAALARMMNALNNAGGAARGAGAASRRAAEEAAQGWARVTEIMGKYATESMDWATNLGNGIVNAFRSAENALGDFVRTGKVDFRSLVRSILADMAQIAARQFIFGPLMRAFSGLLGGLGGGKGGLLSGVLTGGNIPSFAGGGYTGTGERTGGLDGMGGFLALMHPNETVSDHSRGGDGTTNINVNVEGANGDQHVIALVRQGVAAGLEQHDRYVLPGKVKHIIQNPRESG